MASRRSIAPTMIAGTMRTATVAAALVAALAVSASGAAAQPAPPVAGVQAPLPATPRFAFAPVEGGALKLDTETGKVSLCTKGAGGTTGFACIAVPDSRDAYEAEIGRLQAEIAALKRNGPTPPGPEAKPDTSNLDAALDYADHLFRWFKQKVDEMRAPDQSERL